MTAETTVATAADQHRQQPAISETARHLYDAETALHIAPVGAWISAACNRLSEAIADHMRAIAAPQADAESPFRAPFEDRHCIPRMRQNGGSGTQVVLAGSNRQASAWDG